MVNEDHTLLTKLVSNIVKRRALAVMQEPVGQLHPWQREVPERSQSEQTGVEREVMKSHMALLPVESSSEWPGHHSAGPSSVHSQNTHILIQPPTETMWFILQ